MERKSIHEELDALNINESNLRSILQQLTLNEIIELASIGDSIDQAIYQRAQEIETLTHSFFRCITDIKKKANKLAEEHPKVVKYARKTIDCISELLSWASKLKYAEYGASIGAAFGPAGVVLGCIGGIVLEVLVEKGMEWAEQKVVSAFKLVAVSTAKSEEEKKEYTDTVNAIDKVVSDISTVCSGTSNVFKNTFAKNNKPSSGASKSRNEALNTEKTSVNTINSADTTTIKTTKDTEKTSTKTINNANTQLINTAKNTEKTSTNTINNVNTQSISISKNTEKESIEASKSRDMQLIRTTTNTEKPVTKSIRNPENLSSKATNSKVKESSSLPKKVDKSSVKVSNSKVEISSNSPKSTNKPSVKAADSSNNMKANSKIHTEKQSPILSNNNAKLSVNSTKNSEKNQSSTTKSSYHSSFKYTMNYNQSLFAETPNINIERGKFFTTEPISKINNSSFSIPSVKTIESLSKTPTSFGKPLEVSDIPILSKSLIKIGKQEESRVPKQ